MMLVAGGEQREAPLKPPLANIVGSGLGIVRRLSPINPSGRFHLLLDHLADLIFGDGLDDLDCVFLPAHQRLGELVGLLRGDLAGHGRLVRIDDRLHDGRSVMRQRLAQNALRLLRPLDGEPAAPQAFATMAKSIGSQLDAEFRIAFENHLLPFDLAENIVLDDDDRDAAACI